MDHVLMESPAMLLKAVRATQIIAGADPVMTMALHDEGIDLLRRGADRSIRIRVPGPVNTAPVAMRVLRRALMHALAALMHRSAPPLTLTAMDDPPSLALQCGDVRISLPARKADPPQPPKRRIRRRWACGPPWRALAPHARSTQRKAGSGQS